MTQPRSSVRVGARRPTPTWHSRQRSIRNLASVRHANNVRWGLIHLQIQAVHSGEIIKVSGWREGEGGGEMLLLVVVIFLLDVKSITAAVAVKNDERWQKAAQVASLAAIKLRNKYS